MEDNKDLTTKSEQVVLVDDNTGKEIVLENTTTFDKDGKIVDYSTKEVEVKDPEEVEEKEVKFTSAAVKEVPTMEEALSDLGESLNNTAVNEDKPEDLDLKPEDIKESFNDSMFNEGDNKFMISDEDALILMDIVNRVNNKESINIYSKLPESIKSMINKYMLEQGIQGYSVQANSVRNMLASTLIDEFITNISINKSVDSFNKEMEDLFVKTGQEFSKMYKEYDTERTKYLEAALEKIPEDDPKRELISNVLDSINDAYKLTRLKEATSKIKIKNYDREAPERVFSDFEFKYKNNSQYNIYTIKQVLPILYKHLTEEIKKSFPEDMDEETKQSNAVKLAGIESIDFLILFCKFCRNYQVSNPAEHAFMYYTLYNIMLLDIYKGEEYEEFAHTFVNNIIESYKPYYKKIMSEENYKLRFRE